MTSDWSLKQLLSDLHAMVTTDLLHARNTLAHPTDKGDASEQIWTELFHRYLPTRYDAIKAHIVDSDGLFSDQIDIVIRDRQYSPLVFSFKGKHVVPVESVYAVFEAKQELNADHLSYACSKIASVRRLRRTSLPVPTLDGVRLPKPLAPIIGGVVSLSAVWKSPLEDVLATKLRPATEFEKIDIGCIADAGYFATDALGKISATSSRFAVTHFLLELIAKLQQVGTAPMLDVRAYAAHLPV